MAVVREDVAKISVKVDNLSALNNLSDGLDKIKEQTNSISGDSLGDLVKESKKAAAGVEGITEEGEDALEKLKKISKQKFDKTVSGLKSIATTLGKVGIEAGKLLAKGVAVGVAGVGALVAKSITNYAEYEQLVGGVDTLFKDMSGTVQKYADEAYKSAGLSANDYMSTVTSFSASLIQSLGGDTAKAAEYSNRAIIDMSDNANKMGTDMGSIQDAYQGFAKQNYTMLDNLKLGYGGTQEEMKRLISDASKMTGVQKELNVTVDEGDMSFANIVNAISVMQASLGIAGTTAQEASETISGSWSSLKAVWSNTLTSLILGGDDFDRCVDNLVEAAKTFGKNIMPAIVSALEGVGSLITELAPVIEAELPGLIDAVLPGLISAATSLVAGLIVALPDIVGTLIDELPGVMNQLWVSVSTAFGEVPGLSAAKDFLDGLVKLISDNADSIKKLIPVALGLVGVFKAFNAIKGLTGLFGGASGGSGKAGGLLNIKNTASALGSIALTIGGIAGIVAAFAALEQIDGYGEFMAGGGEALKQLCDIIADIGLVGAAFVAFVAVVGEFSSITAAVDGMGVIAVALGGMELVVAAFGALAQIPGIHDFIADGGEMLTQLCNIIGDMAGNLIGGALAGLSDSLPDIGTNINTFATNIAPALETFGSINTTGISDFATALASLIGVLVAENITSFVFGKVDYAQFGTDLTAFMTNASGFFDTVEGIDDAAFGKMTSLFNALAGVKAMPTTGGLKSWVFGDIDFDGVASGLKSLSGEEFIGAIGKIQNIPEAGFTALTNLFNALAGINDLPSEGGIFGWFTGEVSTTLKSIGEALPGLAGHIATFMSTVGSDVDYTKISGLFNTLSGLTFDDIDTKLGNLTSVARALESFSSDKVKSFFSNVGTLDTTKLTNLFGFFTDVNSVQNTTGFTNVANGLGALNDKMKTFKGHVKGLDATKLGAFTSFLTSLGDAGESVTGLETTMSTSLANIVTTADTKLGELKGKFSDYLGQIVVLMNATATAMYSSGQNIMRGVNSGMLSMRGTLIATAQSMASAIQKAFDVKLDIHSPSREGFKSGAFVGEGIDLGMQSKIPDLQATASRMGSASLPFASRYSPTTDGGTVTNNRTSSEYTSIAPVFNLNVSGTSDDRATARKVKRWVNEAIQDVFDSMERKSYVTREA